MICVFFLDALSPGMATTKPKVDLVAGELEPYIGSQLVNNGYVNQLITEAFSRAGYEVTINFYPWARAQFLARSGEAAGIVPLHKHAAKSDLLLSDSFPGGVVGLLKHKDNRNQYSVSPNSNIYKVIQSLNGDVVGTVRGGISLPALEDNVRTENASTDLQNLDKLVRKRVPYILIDKYTAVDLMMGNRPHYVGLLEFMQPALAELDFYLALSPRRPNSRQLLAAFNQSLAQMRQDGTIHQLREAHGLISAIPASDNKTKLTIASVNNPEMQIMQRISSQYELENPDIELEWHFMDETTLRRRLQGDLAISDGVYDVITIGNYEAPIWGERAWLSPFHSFPANYQIEDIFPSNIDVLSYNNDIYALPVYAETVVTYYRSDWFNEAGLTMPTKPSFADIKYFAKRLHKPEQQRYGICLRGKAGWGENMALFTSWLHALGGRWFDEQWIPQLTSAAWQETLSYYIDLLTNYAQPGPTTSGYPELLKLFSNGHCAMWIDASVAAGTLYNPTLSSVANKVSITGAPHRERPSSWLWVWSLAVPSSSKQSEAAKDFILWATSKEYIQHVADKEGWVSVPPGTRASTYSSLKYRTAAPFASNIYRSLESMQVDGYSLKNAPYAGLQYVGISEFSAFGGQVGHIIKDILLGKLTQTQALAEAQSLVYSQMIRSGYIE